MWHFTQSEDHEPTAKVARVLEELEDHILRAQPMDESEIADHHRALHAAYGDLEPEDKAHLKMRLGVIGHQHALSEHEKREASEAGTPPDLAAELVRLRSELAAAKRDNAKLSSGRE
jgi:hypothetical protein